MAAVQYHLGLFPPKDIDWAQLIPHIGPANAAIARYDGTLGAIPNAAVLLSPLTTQEAVLSSRIEGTQATMGEVLQYEAQGENDTAEFAPDRKADIQEVLNYRAAIRHAESMLQTLPLSQRVIRETHEVLMSGVRGTNKSPGEYRKIPNWIGPHGCTIDSARFVPISADKLPDGMSAFEKYIHAEEPDMLVQLAVLHAEFEALHPFLDGNGRLGRMLVPLFLWQRSLIKAPMFYISAFFEANRDEYYDRLLAVSAQGDWTQWCVFFLKAIKQQAELNQTKATDILALYNHMKVKVAEVTRSQYAIHALDWIFERPIFKSTDFTGHANIPDATAKRLLTELGNADILRPMRKGAGRRATVYLFPELLNLAEGVNAF
ncbi:MloA protein, putative [Vibrio cholerae]|nr:Fic family protein [Vibrio cholerae]GIB72267.1 MloA protein, putative [Vibrio cholerae]HDG1635302.1 Fic family protein [Vibrio cholerae]